MKNLSLTIASSFQNSVVKSDWYPSATEVNFTKWRYGISTVFTAVINSRLSLQLEEINVLQNISENIAWQCLHLFLQLCTLLYLITHKFIMCGSFQRPQ